jgi:biotin-(acetyl-CoA carboxylase) ligase
MIVGRRDEEQSWPPGRSVSRPGPAVQVDVFDSLESTSLHARRLVEAEGAGLIARLVVAGTQTGGIGRFRRRWASPRGGLWCTLVWPLAPDGGAVLDGLGVRIGVACLEAVDGAIERAGGWPGHRSNGRTMC